MTAWRTYYLAQSLDDAIEKLVTAPGPARVIAGGTDLLLDMQQGRLSPVDTLVDITQIPELNLLELRQDFLFIGAGIPLNQVLASPLVTRYAEALSEAAGLIGGPQVRNMATLGGNVAHALPAGDGTIALLALGAQAEVADAQGRTLYPIEELFLGPGRSRIDAQREVLVGFLIPAHHPQQGSAHRRVMRPQGVAIAILNTAVWIARNEDRIRDIRIAVGPAGPKPFRAINTEHLLRGKVFGEQLLKDAIQTLREEAHFRTSPHRATAEYRSHLAGILLAEAVTAAWKRAGEGG